MRMQCGGDTVCESAAQRARRVQATPGVCVIHYMETIMKKLSVSLAAIALLGAVAAQAAESASLMGTVVDPSQATRTIVITPTTTSVNVKEGDVVKFIANDKEFGYMFDGVNAGGSIDLQRVAPQGLLAHKLTVYIAPNPDNVDRL